MSKSRELVYGKVKVIAGRDAFRITHCGNTIALIPKKDLQDFVSPKSEPDKKGEKE